MAAIFHAQARHIRDGRLFCKTSFFYVVLVLFGLPRGAIWGPWGSPRALSGDLGASFSCAGCVDPRRLIISYLYEQIGTQCFMRRLRTSAPSGIPGPGGGLCALRRLRRSVCGVFFSCLYVQLMLIFYAQAAGIRPAVILASPRDCSWHLRGVFCICTGCVDPLAAFCFI